MAAIFGLIGAHPPEMIDEMSRCLGHRGPHRQIESIEGRVSVGAVGVDPAGMICRTATSLVVASGTVYADNADSAPGDAAPDVASVLRARVEAAGIAGVSEVDGDFAAVVCDGNGGNVTFLRDFFGCVPLFWGMIENGCLAFASEYKAILALHSFTPIVDREMLQYLQAAKRMPVGRTLLANVWAVCPGITVVENNEVTSYQNYPPITCDVDIRDETQATQVIAGQFREAMRRRGGGIRIGLALSGGIDSIAMAFQLRNAFPDREIHTFSAGFGEMDPEMITASEVAEQIGAHHHAVVTPASLLATSFRKLIWHMEDPCSRSEALQLMHIGEVASQYVDRLLSGQGLDGLFAGMPRHKLIGLAGRLPVVRDALFEIFDLTQLGIQPDSVLGKALAAALYRGKVPPVPRIIDGGTIARPARTPPGRDFLNRVLAAGYQNSAFQDAGKFERTFGASGVGYTSPCLEVSFARLAFTVDERLKIKRGTEKYIFREAISSIVPDKFRSIKKHPQRMLYDVEFADALDVLADDFLSPASVSSRRFFEQSSVDRLRRRSAGRPYAAEAAMRLWTAIATEIWARTFLDREIPQVPV